MQIRQLGKSNLHVSALGLGCMGMSMAYGKTDDAQSLKTLQHALQIGVNFFDTADLYGDGHNEQLIAQVLPTVKREQVVVATKCGFVKQAQYQYAIDASPKHIKAACEGSLKRLGVEVIDLYYLHRADKNVPIEESVLAMADLVRAGKVRYIGLSEVTAATLRRAAKVHPITALQSEYSLWERKPETNHVLATCRELDISFVPYCPLGRGFLTGKIRDTAGLEQNDFRLRTPKFQAENFAHNLKIADAVIELAKEKHCTPAQLALAWLLAQADNMVPIPGTRSIQRLDENMGALGVKLTEKDLTHIQTIIPADMSAGKQYPDELNFEV